MGTEHHIQPPTASEPQEAASEDLGQAQGSAMPPRNPRSSPHNPLRLVGGDEGTLQATLVAWQREQDRLVNRAWRRPGGMARPAGL